MKNVRIVGIIGVFGTTCLLLGCGEMGKKTVSTVSKPVGKATRSVAGILKKPFSMMKSSPQEGYRPSKGSLSSRTSADGYDAPTSPGHAPSYRSRDSYDEPEIARAEVDRAGVVGEVRGTRYQDPTGADADFMVNPLEREEKLLEKREKEEYDKLTEYERRLQELSGLIDEYNARHRQTQQRKQAIRRVRKVIEEDPSAFVNMKDDNPMSGVASGATPGSMDNALFGSGAGAWQESSLNAKEHSEGEAKSGTGQPTGAASIKGPPVGPEEGASMPRRPRAAREALPGSANWQRDDLRGLETKVLETKVLGTEGEGRDIALVLDRGTEHGVESGSIFQIGSGKARTVVIVTQAWPTYAKAVLHPEHPSGQVQIGDRAKQLLSHPVPPTG